MEREESVPMSKVIEKGRNDVDKGLEELGKEAEVESIQSRLSSAFMPTESGLVNVDNKDDKNNASEEEGCAAVATGGTNALILIVERLRLKRRSKLYRLTPFPNHFY
jgi:hypothetical protein